MGLADGVAWEMENEEKSSPEYIKLEVKLYEMYRDTLTIESLGVVSTIQGYTNFGANYYVVPSLSIPVKFFKGDIFISEKYHKELMSGW